MAPPTVAPTMTLVLLLCAGAALESWVSTPWNNCVVDPVVEPDVILIGVDTKPLVIWDEVTEIGAEVREDVTLIDVFILNEVIDDWELVIEFEVTGIEEVVIEFEVRGEVVWAEVVRGEVVRAEDVTDLVVNGDVVERDETVIA